MQSKYYLVDPVARTVTEHEYDGSAGPGLATIQKEVGGYIEAAYRFPTEDVLYVDEEGLKKPQEAFFILADRRDEWPLAGRGVLVGPEAVDEDGEWTGIHPPRMTAHLLTTKIRWVSRKEFDARGKANASDPVATFTTWGPGDDKPKTEILSRRGEVAANVPRKEGDK
jgi:hypothetical protein